MKWWLISDEDVKLIQEALQAPTHEANDYNCQDWPLGKGCRGCEGDKLRQEAVHILNTSLHTTEVIPKDFEEADENQS